MRLVAYRLPSGILGQLLNEPSEGLLERVLTKFKDQIEVHNDFFNEEIKDGAPDLAMAITHLFSGYRNQTPSYSYAYALELISRHLGEYYSNCTTLLKCNKLFIDEVDEKLRFLGVDETCTLNSLIHNLPPWLAEPADSPKVGLLNKDFLIKHRPQINGSLRKVKDAEIKSILTDMNNWFKFPELLLVLS